jgi:glycosyltransferase involved in cell wall biosynthesis
MRHRVLLYSNLLGTGGISNHVFELALLLRRNGADTVVASLSRDLFDARGDMLRDAGIDLVSTDLPYYGGSYTVRHLRALWSWPKRLGLRSFDVVCGFGSGGFFSLFRGFARRNGFLICNDCSAARRTRVLDPHSLTLHAVDGIICLAPSVAVALRRFYHTTVPIRVLPHFTCVGLDLTQVAECRTLREPRELGVAFFGRLDNGKGAEMLLDIWRDLDIGPARLTFYGEGPLRETLQRRVKSEGFVPGVVVYGGYDHKRDLSKLMAETDLVVLPSEAEGLGLVLLEAMAHGVPFVATDVGGPADLAKGNPYVKAVPPTATAVRAGIEELVAEIRAGRIPASSLQAIYRKHYSYEVLAPAWLKAMLEPETFWRDAQDRGTSRGGESTLQ